MFVHNKAFILILFFIGSISLYSQNIVINEIMSSNTSTIKDEDNDFPDWIEIYNSSAYSVNLENYSLSDDVAQLKKWVFPKINLASNQYLLIFASDKDRRNVIVDWNTIINKGEIWKYHLGNSEPPSNWNNISFDDNSWQSGPTGIGYSDGDDSTMIPSTISLYTRKIFTLNNLDEIEAAILHIDYDDAFVAYLNGIEIARSNIGTPGVPPAYNQTTPQPKEAVMYQGGKPEAFNIDNVKSIIVNGANVLAVQIHNAANSSDLSFIPFFTLGFNTKQSPSYVPQILDLPKTNLHTNFKISADGETIILSNSSGEIIDSVYSGQMPANFSKGRLPDGGSNWVMFSNSSPGLPNDTIKVNGVSASPNFSVNGGLYSNIFSVVLTSDSSNTKIYYTLDGSEPTQNSLLFSKPISVNSTKVIRAIAIENNFAPSNVITHTYFINLNTKLPIISLSTNPANFFDPDSGIYALGKNASSDIPYYGANFWQDWERPIHLEFYEPDGTFGFSTDAGVKIYGAYSRANDQKSLAIFTRKVYGNNEIDYPIFPNYSVKKFKSILLRNSGNDWNYTLMRDGLMVNLVKDMDLEKQAFRPSLVFLNGEFWGIYNIREKINEDYISRHSGYDKDSIDILENRGNIVEGDSTNYISMLNFISKNELSDTLNYSFIKNWMDIDEYINYVASEIYFDNTDWPGNNVKLWRQRKIGAKWRWILYDTDFGFGLYDDSGYKHNTIVFATAENGPDWPNPDWSTFLFRNLLKNIEFKNKFLSRIADLMNDNFKPSRVDLMIDSLKSIIEPELPRQNQKWGNKWSNFSYEIQRLKEFSSNRIAYLRSFLIQYFNLPNMFRIELNISPPEAGVIQINQTDISNYTWSGYYFDDIPINLIAKSKRGYKFVRWEGVSTNTNPAILTPQKDENIIAVFENAEDYKDSIIVNEINYNSSADFNTEDWVELYNKSNSAINISKWIFKDEDDTHSFIFPEGSILNSNSYLVLCNDSLLFTSDFPQVKNFIGNLGFGFSGGGELLRLFDDQLNIIDSVHFNDVLPWPTEADGKGSTIELINPNLNNDLPENWAASIGHGSPGEKNSRLTFIYEKNKSKIPKDFELFQNYPNPFNPVTCIRYAVNGNQFVSLKIYDVLGNEVTTLVNEQQPPGYYLCTLNASKLASGIYIYKLIAGKFISSKKLVLIK